MSIEIGIIGAVELGSIAEWAVLILVGIFGFVMIVLLYHILTAEMRC